MSNVKNEYYVVTCLNDDGVRQQTSFKERTRQEAEKFLKSVSPDRLPKIESRTTGYRYCYVVSRECLVSGEEDYRIFSSRAAALVYAEKLADEESALWSSLDAIDGLKSKRKTWITYSDTAFVSITRRILF